MVREERRYLKGELCELTGGECEPMFSEDYFPTDCRRCNVPVVHMLKRLIV